MGEVKLSPLAYLDIFRHCTAKATDTANIFGLLAGTLDEGVLLIKSYIPLSNANNAIDFEKIHQIFQNIDQFNQEHHDSDYVSDEIVGWVRSFSTEDFQITETERKNQVYLQTAYCDKGVALFIPKTGDQYGMQLKFFKDPITEIDLTSQFEDIDWNFGEIEDLDDLFSLIIELNQKRKDKAPLIEEVLK
jgi:hypothetical protein